MTETETPTQMFQHLLPGLASQIQQTPTPMQQPQQDRDPRKRPHARRGARSSWNNNEEDMQQTIFLLTALVLQHEDAHNRVRLSTSMTFFLLQQQGPGSILLPLFKVSQEWQKNRTAGQVVGALRATILSVLVPGNHCEAHNARGQLASSRRSQESRHPERRQQDAVPEMERSQQEAGAGCSSPAPDPTKTLTEVKELIRPDIVARFHASRPSARAAGSGSSRIHTGHRTAKRGRGQDAQQAQIPVQSFGLGASVCQRYNATD